MEKKQIIEIINRVVPEINTKIFTDDTSNNSNKKGIGSNQFRELAGICRHAECYEEIEMLIRYNEAKALGEKKRDLKLCSWASLMKDGKTSFASISVKCMREIRSASDNDEQCLHDLSLFFGYFYWNARVWSAENKQKADQSGSGNTRNNYAGSKNNDRNNNNKQGRR